MEVGVPYIDYIAGPQQTKDRDRVGSRGLQEQDSRQQHELESNT